MAEELTGLHKLIYDLELPYADQNAMADVEGRSRPVYSFGIERIPSYLPVWKTRGIQSPVFDSKGNSHG